MADRDVLELDNAEEFGDAALDMDQADGVDDETVSKLKEKAKRRKGRGFDGSATSREVIIMVCPIFVGNLCFRSSQWWRMA